MEDKELTQWEYKIINQSKINEKDLNELGKEGWESSVPSTNGTIILKRPKEKKETSQGYGRS